ncbi:protein translocase subunit SecF [Calderihabitans maritimus]|uniref:Protein-export membrane protein SecF n=1 Tax=Calderihabitans maritimus TaxID=1246530 RepID=A0A1Z5HT46_9FIRM|nr:protein translocase subunit SecF [Calderihabitans maritimus]GAW92702.1 preprotein translocase subunit SecF [Calderihabitans maritimus]
MNFVGRRKLWYLLSLAVIIPGLISLFVQSLNFGIDFTGGNLLHIRFEKDVKISEVREVFAKFGLEDSSIQAAEGNQFIVRTVELTEEKNDKILKALEERFGSIEVLRNEKVGAVIGRELTTNAIYALVIASLLIVIYISFRFEFLFGIAAIVALLHDVFVTLGIFSLFQIQVDGAFVAAILTIIGYSINDTIVIFDRIRENLKMKRKESLEELVNRSIAQNLTRSINTSLTVIFALLALLFLGGETTKVFALALLIGTIAGTYSSIFTASPLWIDLRNFVRGRKLAQRT